MIGAAGGAGPVLEGLLHRAAVGAAAEMLGAARKCMEMSVEYAKVREQFGQPIGAFQAIKHACAEMFVEVENGHAATYYAAWALDANAPDADLAAAVAKSYVARPPARSAATPSRSTAASASPGSTISTSTSSAPRRSKSSTATPSTTASCSSGARSYIPTNDRRPRWRPRG